MVCVVRKLEMMFKIFHVLSLVEINILLDTSYLFINLLKLSSSFYLLSSCGSEVKATLNKSLTEQRNSHLNVLLCENKIVCALHF